MKGTKGARRRPKLKGKEGTARGLLLKAKGGARVRGLKVGQGAGDQLAVLQRLKDVHQKKVRPRFVFAILSAESATTFDPYEAFSNIDHAVIAVFFNRLER